MTLKLIWEYIWKYRAIWQELKPRFLPPLLLSLLHPLLLSLLLSLLFSLLPHLLSLLTIGRNPANIFWYRLIWCHRKVFRTKKADEDHKWFLGFIANANQRNLYILIRRENYFRNVFCKWIVAHSLVLCLIG